MPVINGVYLKDFPALPSAVTDANIIPIAISGNQIAYRTTVAGIVTDARVTSKLLTGLSVTGSTILATDTILQAFGKVQNQLNGKVSSVGLTMPSAFNVANSPITSAGTLAVTAAGLASQYIRGDGALGDFPNTGGGGSSVSYYLNGSVSQGTIGGNTYYEMNKTPVIGTGTDFSIATDGYIAQFITDANDPASLLIPGGNWNVEMYFSTSSGGGTPSFYVEVYKYDGTTFTLLGSSAATPEGITNGTAIDIYYTSVGIPETVLTITDRLAIRVYVTHSGRTITLHTEDNHLSEIVTTFSNGLTALNGLTKQTQYFATGTTGTDFNISSSVDTHTFNIPSASASARGLITTGTQTFAGDKTFNGTVSGVNVVLSSLTASAALQINRVSGNGILINDVGGGGNASVGINNSVGNSTGFLYQVSGSSQSGTGYEVNATSTYSGIPFIYYKNSAELFKVDTTGKVFGSAANFTGQLTLGSTITNGTYTYTLPSATGTLALTSDIHSAVTLSAIGSTPNANAATLTGQVLNLEPASASFGGVVTTGTQTFAGDKTLTGSLYGIALSMTGTVGDIIGSVATTGKAIRGTATTGFGVYASATTGTAIYGESTGTGGAALSGTSGNGIGGYFLNNATGFATLYVTNNGSGNLASFSNSAGTKFTINNAGNLGNGTYTYTLPSATGTLALTSALSSYLPLSGGTLTGALSGTTALFTNSANNYTLKLLNSGGFPATINLSTTTATAAARNWAIYSNGTNWGDLEFRPSLANGGDPYTTGTVALRLASTGAATFTGDVAISKTSTYSQLQLIDNTASGSTWVTLSGFPALGDYTIREAGVANHLIIKKTTGAATFSSSVTVGTDIVLSAANPFLYGGTSVGAVGMSNISGSSYMKIYAASHATLPNLTQFVNNGSTSLVISAGGVVTISALGTGTVQATAGVLSVISDSKAKDKTGLFQGSALNAINKIDKPQYWNYNAKSELGESTYSVKQFGLFADDIHKALGEEFAPTQTQSVYDEETKETKVEPILIDGSISYSMSDRALLSLAIQAIQELKAEIDLLKGEPIPTDNNLE